MDFGVRATCCFGLPGDLAPNLSGFGSLINPELGDAFAAKVAINHKYCYMGMLKVEVFYIFSTNNLNSNALKVVSIPHQLC